jgi:hypothetical protein
MLKVEVEAFAPHALSGSVIDEGWPPSGGVRLQPGSDGEILRGARGDDSIEDRLAVFIDLDPICSPSNSRRSRDQESASWLPGLKSFLGTRPQADPLRTRQSTVCETVDTTPRGRAGSAGGVADRAHCDAVENSGPGYCSQEGSPSFAAECR